MATRKTIWQFLLNETIFSLVTGTQGFGIIHLLIHLRGSLQNLRERLLNEMNHKQQSLQQYKGYNSLIIKSHQFSLLIS